MDKFNLKNDLNFFCQNYWFDNIHFSFSNFISDLTAYCSVVSLQDTMQRYTMPVYEGATSFAQQLLCLAPNRGCGIISAKYHESKYTGTFFQNHLKLDFAFVLLEFCSEKVLLTPKSFKQQKKGEAIPRLPEGNSVHPLSCLANVVSLFALRTSDYFYFACDLQAVQAACLNTS
jgi:hypothetical protein